MEACARHLGVVTFIVPTVDLDILDMLQPSIHFYSLRIQEFSKLASILQLFNEELFEIS